MGTHLRGEASRPRFARGAGEAWDAYGPLRTGRFLLVFRGAECQFSPARNLFMRMANLIHSLIRALCLEDSTDAGRLLPMTAGHLAAKARRAAWVVLGLLAAGGALPGVGDAAESLPSAKPSSSGAGPRVGGLDFGFSGPETFPIDSFISELRVADIDGDGLNDLLVANNSRSKITILYNRTGQTNRVLAAAGRETEAEKRDLNELPPDARFRIDSIASEKRIAALTVADLNGDKRPDLAYYGEPKELVVQYNQGTNGWSSPRRWPIDDVQLTGNALSSGDLTGSGRPGLVLLGESHLYWLAQGADRTLKEPEKIPFAGNVKSVQVLDINGDNRDDLLLVNWDSANPFRFRLQTSTGQLGPEIHFALPAIRSYWPDDLDGDHRTEVVTISQNSGRAQVSHFELRAAEALSGGFRKGQFSVLPLNKTTKSRRGQAWGDLNGDGRPDLLVAEPDSGQVSVYLQQPDGSLPTGRQYSTLSGVTEILVADAREGQPATVFLLSPDERQVGLSTFDGQGRLPFPTTVPLDGKPLTMALDRGARDGRPTFAVVVDQDGKRTLLLRETDGRTRTQKLSESFKSNPVSMAFHDADQDGLTDLVILIPYEKIKILRRRPAASGASAPAAGGGGVAVATNAAGTNAVVDAGAARAVDDRVYEEIDVAPPGGTSDQPWMSLADVDGDGRQECLLAQKNFLRATVLKSEVDPKSATNRLWSFQVKDQINGAGGNSRIVGAASVRNGTNAVASLFLLDAERKALTLSERDSNGVWQVVRNLPLAFTEFNELRPLALGASRPNAVSFLGVNAVGWLALGGEAWEVVELDGYETRVKDGRLHDVISGDLNQDGRRDLVFFETARSHLDLVIFSKEGRLVPASRWPVFEERSFRARRGDQPEPREGLIVDVTGDGRNDLVLIVHDRILVYPQE